MNNSNNKLNKKILAKKQRNKIKMELKNNKAHINKGIFIYNESLTINEFSQEINKSVNEIIGHFFNKGIILNKNTFLTEDQLGELCLEYGLDFKRKKIITHENLIENFEVNDDFNLLEKRPPIITIMGHVDHGKTTLLDTIRNSNIVNKEYGGITQHIGAYQIKIKNNEKITFIDTPGHEAFAQMRVRGSLITDIIVLVIAADDGVKPQTKEAINHAKSAGVPIIVFINKIDKIGINLNNILIQLSKENLIPKEWGGTINYIKGSAKQNKGINELLNTILLMSDLMKLRANPNRFALGTVIESHLNRGLGPVATLLVQSGTLNIKDAIVVGYTFGYIRNLFDDNGKKIKFAGPSTPVMINGLNEVPNVGDYFMVFQDEKLAREIALKRKEINIINKRNKNNFFSLESLTEKIKNDKLKKINIILKTDTKGTLEVVKINLLKINISGIKINILRANVGEISDNDITLSLTSKSFIIGFNVYLNDRIRKKAKDEGITIRLYKVIYKLIEEIISMSKGMLELKTFEKILGRAEVRQIFNHSDIGTIVGCYVINGFILKKSYIRVLRKGITIYNGKLSSLKHIKDDIKEAKEGIECGLTIKNFNDLKEKDIIESFIEKFIKN